MLPSADNALESASVVGALIGFNRLPGGASSLIGCFSMVVNRVAIINNCFFFILCILITSNRTSRYIRILLKILPSHKVQSPHAEQTAVPVEDVMRHSREEHRETGLLVSSITNSHNFKLDSMRTQRNYVRPFSIDFSL